MPENKKKITNQSKKSTFLHNIIFMGGGYIQGEGGKEDIII